MATAGETIRNVADALALDQATVKSYFREIQKAGLIGKGGRGRSAIHFSSLDTARILVAIMGAQAIAEAPSMVQLMGETACLVTEDEGAAWENYGFEDALVHVLEEIAAKAAGDQTAPHPLLGSFVGRPMILRLSGTDLTAEIVIDDVVEMRFSHFAANSPPMSDPDDWDALPMCDRLRLRAIMGGMSTTRAIDEVALRRIASGLIRVEPDQPNTRKRRT